MQIVKIQQNSEEWLLHRLGKITGSKAKDIRPMARNGTKRYGGFWTILAEKMAVPADGEPPIERGHRLENEALAKLEEYTGKPFDKEPGMWISDLDEDIALSPDGAEPVTENTPLPTYSAEIKCLNSGSHLKYIVDDIHAKKRADYNPIYSVPNEDKHYYRDQCIQYFVVNKSLKTHYFALFDDRVVLDHLVLYVIAIEREDVEDLIVEQENVEMDALVEMNDLVAMLSALGKDS